MNGLGETSLAELEVLATGLREQAEQDPAHSSSELKDVEWEIEKRTWRK